MTTEELQRFTAKVDKRDAGGCWMWTGCTDKRTGYGAMRYRRQTRKPHRIAYEHWVGPIQGGKELDHLCSNRACVNPAHLEVVTHAENVMRTVRRGRYNNTRATALRMRQACDKGHPFDVANTYVSKDGSRHCRVCNAEYQKERRRRLRSEAA